MKLSILIPAYNEEKTISQVLQQIFSLQLAVDFEVIVIDDGSTDLTAEAVKNSGFPVIYLRQGKNSGKGAAIRRGIEEAQGEIILIQDADCEYYPNDYPALITPILSGKAEVVYGSRILKKGNPYSYKWFYWGGRFLSWWTNFLYGTHITDEPTGYKVFKASVLKSLRLSCQGFEFCPEVTAKILREGIKIFEVPISYSPRSIEEGKKISWKDGVMALWVLWKFSFSNKKLNTKTIRILYVSQFSHIGGGEVSLFTAIKHLNREKFKAYFLCYEEGPLVDKIRALGLETTILKRRSFLSSFLIVWKIFRFIKSHAIEIIHVNSLDIRTGVAAWLAGAPCIGHVRVIFPFSWRDRLFVRLSKKTIAVSNAVVQEFCKDDLKLKEKFIVIYNAIDIPDEVIPAQLHEALGIAAGVKLIGAVGRIDPVKGYEYFIDAAALLKEEMPDIAFLIIGKASLGDQEGMRYFEVLKECIGKAALDNYIFFTGFRDDVLNVIAALDVVVVPTIELKGCGWLRTEGFGRVAIEAMAAGVPVIASCVGGLKEIIEDGKSGLLVAPKDAGAIKDAVKKITSDKALKETLVREGKIRVAELFSVRQHSAALTELYTKLINK